MDLGFGVLSQSFLRTQRSLLCNADYPPGSLKSCREECGHPLACLWYCHLLVGCGST